MFDIKKFLTENNVTTVSKVDKFLSEGMMGWSHWEESDNAADWHDSLEDIWKRFEKGRDKAKLKADFQKWHEKILKDKYGSSWDLDGHMALPLIANDKLYKQVHATSGLNVKRYFSEAIKKIQSDLKAGSDLRAGDDGASPGWTSGLKRMIQLAQKWT